MSNKELSVKSKVPMVAIEDSAMTHMNSISGANILNTALGGTQRANTTRETAAGTPAVAQPAVQAGTSTNLSSLGSILATGGTDVSDVRTDKVAALKTAIENGTYHVPAAQVADKLISSLLG